MSSDTSSSNNLFQQSMGGTSDMEAEFLGPTYDYSKNIKSPSDLGMSDAGTLSALGKDVDGLIQYVELLVEGSGSASATGRPLGNKFFLLTGQKCNDVATNTQVDRYIYVDNVPAGNIPFITSGMGVNFSEFKGMIPGVVSNLNVLSPYGIMQSFLSGSVPDCQSITMETVDVNNNVSNETHYVTTTDISNMDPCIFPNGKNIVTQKSCQQAFTNKETLAPSPLKKCNKCPKLPQDMIVQIYFAALAILGIYLLYRILYLRR
jgi:hypothetical protein